MAYLRSEIESLSQHWPAYFIGFSVTVCAVLLFHSLGRLGVDLTGRTTVLFATVVGAAYFGGLRGGFTSALITIIDAIVYFSMPGRLFSFLPEDLFRVIAIVVTVPIVALAVGSLRHKVDRYEAEARAREKAAPGKPAQQ